MRIFLDANILVSVLNKEYPFFTYTSRIISLNDTTKFTLFTSPVCLAIAFYFAEKKYKSASAKKRIQILCDHINIAAANRSAVLQSLQNPAVNDFEDGLEYYSAIEAKCECIITEDIEDFYFSKIEVLSSERFVEKYLLSESKK
ncbi:MAG: PIN domain-containing protein [Chitinophagaceae bacterium]|jgi:predicted nucleic acid-binding protein|nr:PIN domain-containing protein [Chitinophagaceae bacterium]